MEKLSLTALRKRLYEIVDRVLETGVPAVVERKGRRVLIVADEPVGSKMARLPRRRGIVGDPDDLVDVKVWEWHEPRNVSSSS